VKLFFTPEENWNQAFDDAVKDWQRSYTPMAIEVLSLSRGQMAHRFRDLLQQKTGQDFGFDTNEWFDWWWQQAPSVDDSYATFKSRLYGLIDENSLATFRSNAVPASASTRCVGAASNRMASHHCANRK